MTFIARMTHVCSTISLSEPQTGRWRWVSFVLAFWRHFPNSLVILYSRTSSHLMVAHRVVSELC